jgi:hypothetical protein
MSHPLEVSPNPKREAISEESFGWAFLFGIMMWITGHVAGVFGLVCSLIPMLFVIVYSLVLYFNVVKLNAEVRKFGGHNVRYGVFQVSTITATSPYPLPDDLDTLKITAKDIGFEFGFDATVQFVPRIGITRRVSGKLWFKCEAGSTDVDIFTLVSDRYGTVVYADQTNIDLLPSFFINLYRTAGPVKKSTVVNGIPHARVGTTMVQLVTSSRIYDICGSHVLPATFHAVENTIVATSASDPERLIYLITMKVSPATMGFIIRSLNELPRY